MRRKPLPEGATQPPARAGRSQLVPALCRLAAADEMPEVSTLAIRSFQQCVAPLYVALGITNFLAYASSEALQSRCCQDQFVLVAENDEHELVGMAEVRANRHISMLFVDPDHQRQGVGRALLGKAIALVRSENPALQALTVNASPNAVGAYRRFGFRATAAMQKTDGIIYRPMALNLTDWVDSRS